MVETLRGNPTTLRSQIRKCRKNYGRREDGTSRGPGYFGEIYDPEEPNCYATECVYRGTIPLLVPGLTRDEIAHLVAGGEPTHEMIKTAQLHALVRAIHNESPFAQWGEQRPLPA